MPLDSGAEECAPETPIVDSRKRVHGSGRSATNLHSQKRRRLSFAVGDLISVRPDAEAVESSRVQAINSVDRFVPNRPKTFLPLNITPRTRRISKQFGLTDDKVLIFNDDMEIGSSSTSSHRDENTIGLLRRSASSLFQKPPVIHASSVIENLNKRKECLAILDSPGVSKDPNAFPISWSRHNLIAVVCLFDIFYQNVTTKTVSQLGRSVEGNMTVIQWAGDGLDTHLAAGNNRGSVLIWDVGNTAGQGQFLRSWQENPLDSVKSLCWNENIVTAGTDSGELTNIDIRAPKAVFKFKVHHSPLVGLQWSTDRTFLATGDTSGVVNIWDQRAGKSMLNSEATTKIRHKGNVRALAWCPWQRDLLATGTTSPEGKIRIWSTSSITSPSPSPVQTIPLNTSVTSLHWSPHCKELLSTHGSSFTPALQSRSQNNGTSSLSRSKTPLMNSITVHQYPSCKRLMTLTNAHTSAVTHSCLGPNGESLFTICPREETIKMWKVWTAPKPIGKKESAFDKYAIR